MNILILTAHEDDMELGCSGTMMKYLNEGHSILDICLCKPDEVRANEKESIIEYINKLDKNYKHMNLGYQDNSLFWNKELIPIIDNIIKDFKPDILISHWAHSSHPDHIATYMIANACSRNVKSFWCFEEIARSHHGDFQFRPQLLVNIDYYMPMKVDIIKLYNSQINKYGKNILTGTIGLNKLRGYHAFCDYAEAFEIIKYVC